VAALVPVGVICVQSWRDVGGEPELRVAASAAHMARPQLGRFSPRQSVDAGGAPVADAESAPAEDREQSDSPTVHGGPHAGVSVAEMHAAGHMVTASLDTPRQSAERRPRRGGAAAGLPGSSPAATSAGSGWAGGGSAASGLAVVEFVGVMQDLTLLKRNDFLADLVRQLKIIVYWNVAGKHAQRLELFTPEGVLYRRVATDFTGTGGAWPGTPVETQLPVGGTWITEHSLFGAWRVDVFLDGKPATSASFVLNN
jgi:hypothetical protein